MNTKSVRRKTSPEPSIAYLNRLKCSASAEKNRNVIVVVFGVSGVGKSLIAKLLAQELGWDFHDADDFHPATNLEKMRAGIPLTDADRSPWLDRLSAVVEGFVAADDNAVLACSALKRAYRDRLSVNGDVRFVYLRGDAELIATRLRQRADHFMNPALLQSQFDDLEEPRPDEAVITIDSATAPAAIVSELRKKLPQVS